MRFLPLLLILLSLLSLLACQTKSEEKQDKTPEVTTTQPSEPATTQPAPVTEQSASNETEQTPPTPPLYEDFQGAPQLSLFPRAGAFRPADDDEQGLQFWRTYIEHMARTSGPLKTGGEDDPNIAFGFRAIKGLDSVGVFSPIAVTPETRYEVTSLISCDLGEGASAGIGILEYDQFRWIGEQFSEAMAKEFQVGTQPGLTLEGKVDKQAKTFTFTTGPKTNMIHLVFFRDGAQNRNPVIIDNIGMKPATK